MWGNVGKNRRVFQRVHGGKGYGQRNREGERILESMESLDLALVNTVFNKNEEHLITYKSGGNSSQIYFIITRRADLKEMRDFKVIPGEEVVFQGSDVLVSAKERGPREASEASRSNIPWSINSSENHAWQN